MRPLPKDLPVEELRQEFLDLSYLALERCVSDLLAGLGYHSVHILTRKHLRQRTAHGGYDLVARGETGLTEESLIVQIKQYRRPVSRRFVDELRGAMLRAGAGHGLLITLSSFPLPAHRAAQASHVAPIRLVDGAELAMLFVFRGIGVTEDRHGEIRVDQQFFGRLRAAYPRTANQRKGAGHKVTSRAGLSRKPKGGDMLYRTHALGAIGSLWLLAPLPGAISGDNLGVMAALAAVGALLPDLDAARSTAKNLSIKGIRPLAPLSDLLHRSLGHRGALHAASALPVVAVLCAALAPLWGVWPSAALWLGYASHLALDACTKSGIPKTFRGNGRVHLLPKRWRFTAGSMAEDALLPFLAAAVIVLALAHAPQGITTFP